jgi:hypothetical protein
MNKAGSSKIQNDLQRQIDRSNQLGMLDLAKLMEKKTARGSVDDLIKIYTMLEDKLNVLNEVAAA